MSLVALSRCALVSIVAICAGCSAASTAPRAAPQRSDVRQLHDATVRLETATNFAMKHASLQVRDDLNRCADVYRAASMRPRRMQIDEEEFAYAQAERLREQEYQALALTVRRISSDNGRTSRAAVWRAAAAAATTLAAEHHRYSRITVEPCSVLRELRRSGWSARERAKWWQTVGLPVHVGRVRRAQTQLFRLIPRLRRLGIDELTASGFVGQMAFVV